MVILRSGFFARSHARTLPRSLLFSIALSACSTNSPGAKTDSYHLLPLAAQTTASMRGVSVVNARVAWASGTGGSVLRTVDGGVTWTIRKVPNADSLDFRDIAAFDSANAYVLSAGEDGRIYRTSDGGATWRLLFQNKTKGAFFDCFDFWDARHGLAMSDPVGGRFLLLRTDDGEHWHELTAAQLPRVLEGEAAFAASGTCLVTSGTQRAYLATGGGAAARVLVSDNRGDSWNAVPTPVVAGAASAGIFSLAFRDESNGIAIGGDYQKPAALADAARTTDGGKSWTRTGQTMYVSGAAYLKNSEVVVAVGTRGTRLSRDNGATWMSLDSLEYNAVQLAADGTGYAVGPRGRIAKLIKR